jgi:hypothetical protein
MVSGVPKLALRDATGAGGAADAGGATVGVTTVVRTAGRGGDAQAMADAHPERSAARIIR